MPIKLSRVIFAEDIQIPGTSSGKRGLTLTRAHVDPSTEPVRQSAELDLEKGVVVLRLRREVEGYAKINPETVYVPLSSVLYAVEESDEQRGNRERLENGEFDKLGARARNERGDVTHPDPRDIGAGMIKNPHPADGFPHTQPLTEKEKNHDGPGAGTDAPRGAPVEHGQVPAGAQAQHGEHAKGEQHDPKADHGKADPHAKGQPPKGK
jgi:hypothetical protein